MTNLDYIQSLPIDLFQATIGGLMGIEEMKDPIKANDYLLKWLESEVDEGFCKDDLKSYCSRMDGFNQLIAENKKLREDNEFLTKEVSKIARESVQRSKVLAKLEAEIKRRINEYDPNQMTFDEVGGSG